jgi:acyl-CoA thioesterase
VGPDLLNSGGTLWGGCGLSAALAVGEEVLGRGALWATVQYISPIVAGERLELHLEIGRHGRGLSQAAVRGTVDGRPALLATGTFGGRDDARGNEFERQFVAPPDDVPAPDRCPDQAASRTPPSTRTGLKAQIEQRWALPVGPRMDGTPGVGRSAVWMRLRRPLPTSVVALALMADFAPAALSEALGVPTYGVSLDNSIRLGHDPGAGRTAGSGWVLLDVQVETFVRGVAQLNARMFDQDGRLLATAGQSALVRRHSSAADA